MKNSVTHSDSQFSLVCTVREVCQTIPQAGEEAIAKIVELNIRRHAISADSIQEEAGCRTLMFLGVATMLLHTAKGKRP